MEFYKNRIIISDRNNTYGSDIFKLIRKGKTYYFFELWGFNRFCNGEKELNRHWSNFKISGKWKRSYNSDAFIMIIAHINKIYEQKRLLFFLKKFGKWAKVKKTIKFSNE